MAEKKKPDSLISDPPGRFDDAPPVLEADPPAIIPDAPKPDEPVMSVLLYCHVNDLRRWQRSLLLERLGSDKELPAAEIKAALEKFSKEAI